MKKINSDTLVKIGITIAVAVLASAVIIATVFFTNYKNLNERAPTGTKGALPSVSGEENSSQIDALEKERAQTINDIKALIKRINDIRSSMSSEGEPNDSHEMILLSKIISRLEIYVSSITDGRSNLSYKAVFTAIINEFLPDSTIEFLHRISDDFIIHYGEKGLTVTDVNVGLKKHGFKTAKIRDSNGRKTYDDNLYTGVCGIDVSTFQGDIDWNKVANDGIEFVMIRLGFRGYGNGALVLDARYEKNIDAALSAGLDVGVYFFSQAINTEEAVEEATFVIESLKGRPITFPIVFDMEKINDEARADNLTKEEITAITVAFCEKIKQAGFTPMIYGNIAWFMENLDLEQIEGYDKWFAQYFSVFTFPYEIKMWQYTSNGQVNGISGNVDINMYFKKK